MLSVTLLSAVLADDVDGFVCFSSIEFMPVTCSGTITADDFDGCRKLACSDDQGSISVLACEKPDVGAKEYFEMYKQSSSGIAPELCLGTLCLSNQGFASSSDYPICVDVDNGTSPPINETQEDDDIIQDPPITEGVCYDRLEHMPVTCDGGSISSDVFDGCRTIICDGVSGELKVLACEKPDVGDKEYFEVYKQSESGTTPQICIGETCIQNNGYAKSNNYPWCTQETSPPSDEETPPSNTTLPLPVWIEPSQGLTGVPTDYFHLATTPPLDDSHIVSSDWEVWTIQSTEDVNNTPTIPGREDEVYVRVVSADPATRTYTFSCRMSPETTWQRAWHIRPDSGTDEYIPDEAGDIRTAADEFLTYTFEEDSFYHVGCLALNPENFSKSYRGDLHIDLRTSSWDPEIIPLHGQAKTGTYSCEYSGSETPEWLVIDARTGELTNLASENLLVHTVPGHGIYDYICRVGAKSTGMPIEYFDLGDPYFPDAYGIPDGVFNTRSTEESTGVVEEKRVWYAYENTNFIKYHTHTPDGVFENQATQLEPLTTYQTRVRYRGVDEAVGPWSEWRTFTTQEQQVINPSSPDWAVASGFRVEKVASGFDLPVHLAFASDNYQHLPVSQRPYFYVTELYGQIKTVYPDGTSTMYADNLLNFDPFGSITGAGQMGLVSLYVEPETGDVYAGMVYLEGDDVYNRILKFTTNQDGNSYTGVQTIIDELPSGPSHQIQEITRGPDGKLYVNLGEGLVPNNAQKDDVLSGKIIRMNMDGSDVEVYAKGFRNPFGGDWRPGYDDLYVTDNAPDTGDRLVKVVQGENYGWGLNDNFTMFKQKRIDTLNVSPVGVAFNPGHHGFDGELYVAVAGPIYQQGPVNGKHILEYTLDESGEVSSRRVLVEYSGSGYTTPIGLRFGADGLYFTDIYGEPGFVGLAKTEASIYRVVPGEPVACPECVGGDFRAGISIISWYPQDTGDGIAYIFECQGIDGSGSYSYEFGLGNGAFSIPESRQYVEYGYENHDYTITCFANDLESNQRVSASMVINPSNFIAE